ncbi:unnamed protein product, partial [Mesorhabditis belari]|uniref:Uncharacterized protein n=1 Tax=Mesorhabditis belari TaxID=2138241 RepID=A0AAF3ENS4_9BILA
MWKELIFLVLASQAVTAQTQSATATVALLGINSTTISQWTNAFLNIFAKNQVNTMNLGFFCLANWDKMQICDLLAAVPNYFPTASKPVIEKLISESIQRSRNFLSAVKKLSGKVHNCVQTGIPIVNNHNQTIPEMADSLFAHLQNQDPIAYKAISVYIQMKFIPKVNEALAKLTATTTTKALTTTTPKTVAPPATSAVRK